MNLTKSQMRELKDTCINHNACIGSIGYCFQCKRYDSCCSDEFECFFKDNYLPLKPKNWTIEDIDRVGI